MTKKANGVYYTPQPIVDYIVRSTLSPLLDGKSLMQLAGRNDDWNPIEGAHPLTILDPACGTGHFLLGAYQFLLDWCLQWYCEHEPEQWLSGTHSTICQEENAYRLLPEERRRILSEHIFGVDIDEQAIETAKRSLLALVSEESIQHVRLDNIRCGNSLIGSDYNALAHGDLGTAVLTFDWDLQFSSVMTSGGFDAIIGNPPYVNARLVKQEQGEMVKQYYRERYRCARRAFDLYVLFIERSHELLRGDGRAGMIVPNKIATLDYAKPCRELLLSESTLDTVTDVSTQQLFRQANVYPYIITWTKRLPTPQHRIRIVTVGETECLSDVNATRSIRQSDWSAEAEFAIHETINVEARVSTHPLSQRATIHSGTTGFSATQMANALQEQKVASHRDLFDFIVSGNIDRYAISLGNVRFMKRVFDRPVLPHNAEVLAASKRQLFSQPKIVIAGMSRRLEAAYDCGGLALGVQVYAVADFQEDPRFLLALLNSRLMSYLLCTRFQAKRLAGGYLAINKGQLAKLPIRVIDAHNSEAVIVRDRIIELVSGLRAADTDAEHEIDRLVYRLYKLTHDEIETVEQFRL